MPAAPPSRTRVHAASSSPVTASRAGRTALITLRGSLDDAARLEFEKALLAAEASDAAHIVVDLDEVVALDALSLHALLRAGRRSEMNGDRLRVTRGSGYVAEIFRIASLDRTLRFQDASN